MTKLSLTRKVALGELGAFRNGVNFSKEQMGSGLKLINVKNIFGDSPWIDFENLDLVDLGDKSKLSTHTVDQNDLFFVRSSVKRDGIGLVRLANSRRTDAIHCGFVIRYRLNNKETDALFLTYLLRSQVARQKVINLSGGSAIINISQSALASLVVDLPPLPTQRKIAAILSAYDDLIENNLRRIKILEDMAQNLYREWFVKFRFPGHQHVRFTDSPLGRIPEGWEVVKIKDVADVNARSIRKEGTPAEIAYIDIASVSPGSIDKIEMLAFAGAPSRARRITMHGDLIWSSVRPNRRSFSLVIDPPANLVVSTGFAVISAKRVPFTYLYQAVTTDDFVVYLVNHAKGAAYPAVNAEDFENADILVSSKHLLSGFDDKVLPIVTYTHRLKAKITTLRRTRDLLLPQLISGEVDASELDIAVPDEVSA